VPQPNRKIGFRTIGYREQGAKNIREEEQKGARGDKIQINYRTRERCQ
jgi:hypothetical protein